jgi:hypothetical protein
MLSNNENRLRMRCKLIENLQFDSHFEASRLRDYSGYSGYFNGPDSSTLINSTNKSKETNSQPAESSIVKKFHINKEAINMEINEDFIGDEEFLTQQQQQQQPLLPTNQQQQLTQITSSNEEFSIRTGSTSSSMLSTSTSTTNIANIQPAATSTATPPQPKSTLPYEHYESISQLDEKEKLIIRSECELITVTRVIKGRFELTNKCIYFYDTYSLFYCESSQFNDSNESMINAQASSSSPNLANSFSATTSATTIGANITANPQGNTVAFIGFSCHDFDILNDFKIPLTQLKEVQLRRYNLRRSALEFFLIDQSNFFINFNKNVIISANLIKKRV